MHRPIGQIRRTGGLVVALLVGLCLSHRSLYARGTIVPFTEEAITRGLVYEMQPWPQTYGHFGFGCGFADLDDDGDPDAIVLGAADAQVGIFENLGNGYFLDRSSTSTIPPLPQGSGLAAGDYDGDGRIDLYLTQIGLPNLLMKNMGGFIFSDVTASSGVGDSAASESACFGDFDNDGWLDLYVCNYSNITADNTSKLFRNQTDGTFEDVSQAQSVDDASYGFQAVWFDYNRDGNLDLYLSNDKGFQSPFLPNQLWRNDGGLLTNVSAESQANVALFSMGVACGDFDGNGWPDLYCTNEPGGGGMDNPLLLNDGAGHFAESGVAAGVDNPFTSWGAIFFDFDNDGRLDLYVNNMFAPASTAPGTSMRCWPVATGTRGRTRLSITSDWAQPPRPIR